jgi:type II secretory pathway pseudopilin PulG
MNRLFWFRPSWFTIPELLVVITILWILSTIGFVSFSKYNVQARDTVRITDVQGIIKVLWLQRLDKWYYPVSSNAIDVTYSGAVVWSQGEFWDETKAETGKIFWELEDPKYNNKYTYSVTQNRKEYQIWFVLEDENHTTNLFSFGSDLFSPAVAYADTPFSPDSLNPKIWLDAMDVNADWNESNNPSNGSNMSEWKNKSSLWAINDPVLTDGNLRYSTSWYSDIDNWWYLPWVFIQNSRWLELTNSEITNGAIFYVVKKRDPFNGTDSRGYWMYGVNNSSYYFWYDSNKRKNTLRLGSSPNISWSKGSSTDSYIYELLINNGSFDFYDTGGKIDDGFTNGAAGVTWGFNEAGSSNRTSDLIISEILIFDYVLDSSEREMIEWYLAHKWGQTYYLPYGHPYKSEPPVDITPPAPDLIPDPFTIDDVLSADPNTSYISNAFTVTDINTPVTIEVTNGEYSVGWGSYTSLPGNVSEWDVIRARITSSGSSLGSVSMRVTIWWVFDDFIVTTKNIDDTPDDFVFSSIIDSQRSVTYESNTNQITWINVPLSIAISWTWAEYKITDGVPVDVTGAWSASGDERNWSSLAAYAFDDNLSSGWASPNSVFPAELMYDLGSGNAQKINAYTLYRSSSQSSFNNDRYSPEDWLFQASNNGSSWVTLDTQSNELIGRNSSARVFEFSNSQFFRYYRLYISDAVNSNRVNLSEVTLLNVWDGTYTSSPWIINDGDYVVVKNTSSSEYETDTVASLEIGLETKTFTITTERAPADYDPDVFTFAAEDDAAPGNQYISNPINILGITANTSISITGWEYEINESWTWSTASSPNLVALNDTISVRGTAQSWAWQVQNVVLNVWAESGTYTITTLIDAVPETFSFSEKTDVEVDTPISSNTVTITDINTQIPIENISGGEYSINNGSWRTGNSQLNNNDTVVLRIDSSSSYNTASSMDVDIGGITYTFDITTEQADITPADFTFLDIENADLSFLYISEAIQVTDINSPTAISIVNGEYRIGNWDFTSDAWFVDENDTVAVRLMSANIPNQSVNTQLTIGWVSDYFEVETKDVTVEPVSYPKPTSNIFVWWDYNGLITYAYTWSTHYVLTTPSILTYDLSNTNLVDILAEKKLVYNGFDNVPETYRESWLTMSWGFDFAISSPVIFEWTKVDLWSYSWLKEVDEGIRWTYNTFPSYGDIAKYLDTYSLNYLEDILWNSIGINPIKPYYCSDILRTKLVYNIALDATINADTPEITGMEGWINNAIISAEDGLDPEYISMDGNAWIDFSWPSLQKIGYIRIYNTIDGRSQDLSDAVITFYNEYGWIMDTHNIGFDTRWDYVVDLDFESIGKIYHAQKVRIQTTGGKKLSLREVEIYLGGELQSGTYKVDKDGLWGLSPYNVYCDMETEWGWWTRIWENYITNGKFLKGAHTIEYTSLDPLQNVIVDGTTKLPPVYSADAHVLRHNGSINQYYELSFDSIPGKYYAQEIRLWAWVDGTNTSIFSYDLDYEVESDISWIAEFEVTQTDGTWEYVETRIPLDDVVENFTWKLWDQIAWPIYVTDLNMEVFYK